MKFNMKFTKTYEFHLILRVALLLIGITGVSFTLVHNNLLSLIFLLAFVVLQIYLLIKFLNQRNVELTQFVEAIQYKDFTQSFNEKHSPASLKNMRKAFNTLNNTFKILSIEKEAQHQYLQKILEIVDTGILSYNHMGEVKWMNEALKKILDIPYLKNIKSLEQRNNEVYNVISNLSVGESVILKQDNKKYLLSKTSFKEENKTSELVVFQNVSEAIDEVETQAWQKLLRVMTHEIMNSVAPIASLADTLQHRLKLKDEFYIEDLTQGMEVIKNRSEGLLRFATIYRNFNKINEANFSKIFVRDILENIEVLMDATFQEKNIHFEVILKDTHLQINADAGLIEQVLINLIVNAIEAVKTRSNGCISVCVYQAEAFRVCIEVSDNGEGIDSAVLDQIFVPFFTTKKNGSGVGLSLSKQILSLHKGSLNVKSTPGQGSTFVLEL
jgi:two-component system, NtrC family, nitrogen regulation sensor histidine kinase NtrY